MVNQTKSHYRIFILRAALLALALFAQIVCFQSDFLLAHGRLVTDALLLGLVMSAAISIYAVYHIAKKGSPLYACVVLECAGVTLSLQPFGWMLGNFTGDPAQLYLFFTWPYCISLAGSLFLWLFLTKGTALAAAIQRRPGRYLCAAGVILCACVSLWGAAFACRYFLMCISYFL